MNLKKAMVLVNEKDSPESQSKTMLPTTCLGGCQTTILSIPDNGGPWQAMGLRDVSSRLGPLICPLGFSWAWPVDSVAHYGMYDRTIPPYAVSHGSTLKFAEAFCSKSMPIAAVWLDSVSWAFSSDCCFCPVVPQKAKGSSFLPLSSGSCLA